MSVLWGFTDCEFPLHGPNYHTTTLVKIPIKYYSIVTLGKPAKLNIDQQENTQQAND